MAQPSSVPEHLRPFFRPDLTTEPQVQYSYTSLPSTSSAQANALYPPRCFIIPKRTLCETLKDILLKDWQGTRRRISLPSRISNYTSRPVVMRMKDSEDYITARAANPRTGLISPSIGSRTPHLSTPSTPGEALQLSGLDEQPPSPPPELTIRPRLQRANESRKLSARGSFIRRSDGNGWTTGADVAVTSPRVAHIKAEANLLPAKSRLLLDEDQFVVRMPSAHEPQPYAYPGYSSKQIKAFEHYKRKARRISDEGYDQRLLHGTGKTSKISASGGSRSALHDDVPDLVIPKKRQRALEKDGSLSVQCYCDDADLTAISFAPFTSAKTPVLAATGDSSTAMKMLPEGAARRTHCKAVGGAAVLDSNTRGDYLTRASPEESLDRPGVTDLRRLPRVTLVHPSRAGIPHSYPLQQKLDRDKNTLRIRSSGCDRDLDRNASTYSRAASHSGTVRVTGSLFDHQREPSDEAMSQRDERGARELLAPQLYEILITAFIGVANACGKIQPPSLPRIGIFDVLYAQDTTPQQKASALKTMLSSAGQAVILLMILAILWQVGSMVFNVLEMVLWPLRIPFRVLRWLAGAS